MDFNVNIGYQRVVWIGLPRVGNFWDDTRIHKVYMVQDRLTDKTIHGSAPGRKINNLHEVEFTKLFLLCLNHKLQSIKQADTSSKTVLFTLSGSLVPLIRLVYPKDKNR